MQLTTLEIEAIIIANPSKTIGSLIDEPEKKAKARMQILLAKNPDYPKHLVLNYARVALKDEERLEKLYTEITSSKIGRWSAYSIAGIERTDDIHSLLKKVQEKTQLDFDTMLAVVCSHYKVTAEQIKSPTRKREIVIPRQVFHWLAMKKYKIASSLSDLGKFTGGRDHSTVIHSCQTVQDLMDTDKTYKAKVEDLVSLVDSSLYGEIEDEFKKAGI